ncbi:hypothetical protein TI05_11160 [Achromatium sp. WMS3]|nr:hypothetical protein TI05_11160 [Achromatium sp. WMS3]
MPAGFAPYLADKVELIVSKQKEVYMLVKAKKVKDGLFIPMLDQLKHVQKEYILVNIELIETKVEDLEKKHKNGYLKYPVVPGEFDDLVNEQVWCDNEAW